MKKMIGFPLLRPFVVPWNRVVFAFCLALLLSVISFTKVFPQSSSENEDWTEPVNLSHSGSGSYPFVIVDSNRVTHAVWFDLYEGPQHAQVGEDGVWTEPNKLVVPFLDLQPRVILTPNDYVYTFWLSERTLMYSRVKSTTIGVSTTWGSAQVLATDVLAFDVYQDQDGIIHSAYIQQSRFVSQPAGIYYRNKPVNRGWTLPVEVYTSQYFRTMRSSQAFVSMAVGEVNDSTAGQETGAVKKIFVAWDDPLLNRSMVSSSLHDSNLWEEPVEVDPHVAAADSTRSFGPSLVVWNHQVLLAWKKELSQTTCEVRYKVSADGQEWREADEQFTSMNGCPADSGFLMQNEEYVVWQGILNEQVVLTAWNGQEWSKPRIELDLAGFRDPLTGKNLSIGSRSFFFDAETSQLLVIGTNQSGIQDIWFTRKELGSMEDWFLSYSSWNPEQKVGMVTTDLEFLNLESDSEDKLHALWLEPVKTLDGSLSSSVNSTTVVYYASWNEEGWSEIVPVISDYAGGIQELSTVTNHQNILMAIWRGDTDCQISFTRVPAARASIRIEWMEPVILPTPAGICSSPSLAVGEDQMVYAVYALAVNEGRGIYLNRSIDGGREWEDPIQVFDAQAAAWDMVGQPVLAMQDGRMYVHWQHPSPLNPEVGHGFGFAYSDDGGLTWTTEEFSTEEKLRWSGMAVSKNGVLVRVWQQDSPEYSILTSQTSIDGGQTWSPMISIAKDGEVVGTPALITDTKGGIHLLQAIRDSLGKLTLHHWIRSGNDWTAREKLSLGYSLNANHFDLASIATQQDQLMVLFTGYDNENEQKILESVLSQVGVAGGLGSYTVVDEDGLSSNSNPDPVEDSSGPLSETSTVEPSPMPAFSTERIDSSGSTSAWVGPIVGAVLGGLLVAGVFVVGILKKKR